MKANEAPEKIFICDYGSELSYEWHSESKFESKGHNDIEYTRTDIFEKPYKIWVAHDKNAFTVWLYNERPVLNKDDGCFCSKAKDIVGNVDESLLPDVTYENSPIEYEIIFKKLKAAEE